MSAAGASLAGRTALVTGGARNIGAAIALRLAGAGASVAVVTHGASLDAAERLADGIRAKGGRALALRGDVTDEASVSEVFDTVARDLGDVGILVSNAALRLIGPTRDMPFADWRRVLGIALDGAFLCTRAALPGMLRAGFGRIVLMGGLAGHRGAPERAAVAAAKAGLVGFAKALAAEHAAQGITANCVVPGPIHTARDNESRSGHIAVPPVGRFGTVEEIAEAVLWLAGAQGGFVTGQPIHVNGGMYMP